MSTKKEALPKTEAESARATDEERKGCERAGADATKKEKDEGSVAPALPTSPESEPRRSGAV